jgi:hypothetical protein
MGLVTIPFNYEELAPSDQAAIVPICIRKADADGRAVAWGWFEAVESVQDGLRTLARCVLEDIWRVSELAEQAVHGLWRDHGYDLGCLPGSRVYKRARWLARDLKAGTWQGRRQILKTLADVDQVVRERILVDPTDYARMYQRNLDFDALSDDLASAGLSDVSQMLDLLRDGCTWDEVGQRLGKKSDAVRIKFRRTMARFVRLIPPAQRA